MQKKKGKYKVICTDVNIPQSVLLIAHKRTSLLLTGLHCLDYSIYDLVLNAYLLGLTDLGEALANKANNSVNYIGENI